MTETAADTSYLLAPALGVRLVGRSVVSLAVLVVVATVVGLLTGAGWALAGLVAGAGLVAVAAWGWRLLRRARALRLNGEGYVVRLLSGVGVSAATWSHVAEAVATSPGGERCLELRLDDGRLTRLPMAALAADPDVVAHDVRRRLRDAHSTVEAGDDTGPA